MLNTRAVAPLPRANSKATSTYSAEAEPQTAQRLGHHQPEELGLAQVGEVIDGKRTGSIMIGRSRGEPRCETLSGRDSLAHRRSSPG